MTNDFMGWSVDAITPEQWDCMSQMLMQGDLAWERGHVDRAALELEEMGIFNGFDAGDEVDFMFAPDGQRFAEEMMPVEYL